MWIEVVASFLGISLALYAILAGADFGAGILELFARGGRVEDQRELISHAMAPVWEANHVWLILAVVILFNGFPKAFSDLSIAFHIPLSVLLVGIVIRGCAFTFRHYDAIRDRSQEYYSRLFSASSLITPFFLGLVAGGIASWPGPRPSDGFAARYVSPWLDFFPVTTGLFTCALFSFLASVYLIGETRDGELRAIFVRRAKISNLLAIVAGGLVFLASWFTERPVHRSFFSSKLSLASIACATFVLLPLWIALNKRRVLLSRVFAAAQIVLVLCGWYAFQFPVLVGPDTLYNSAAPEATLRPLTYALIAGCAVIFPALFYLLRIFKLDLGDSSIEKLSS